MKTKRLALALTLWILLGLLSEIFQFSVFVYGFTALAFFLNLVFLVILHHKAEGWPEFVIFGYINGKIVCNYNNKFRRFFWECAHKLAREYYWLKFKFAR